MRCSQRVDFPKTAVEGVCEHWVRFVGEEWVVVIGSSSVDHECANAVVLDRVVEPGRYSEDSRGGCMEAES